MCNKSDTQYLFNEYNICMYLKMAKGKIYNINNYLQIKPKFYWKSYMVNIVHRNF